jgi:translation initiation factor IF-1
MVSPPKIMGVISCSVVLCLSLATITQAFGPNPCATRKGGLPNLLLCSEEKQQGIRTIKGEVLRVDGDTLLVEWFNGKEVRLHLDATVKNGSKIDPGDRIEAKLADVNYEERVLAIREIN